MYDCSPIGRFRVRSRDICRIRRVESADLQSNCHRSGSHKTAVRASDRQQTDCRDGFSPELTKRINAGEQFDILAAPPAVLDNMIKAGKLKADTRTLLVSSDVGVEVRAGAPKPDISTVAAFKQALLDAKSITYLATPGVPQLLERLGVVNAIKSKSTVPDTDIVSELVAKGEVELGIVLIAQILTTPGVELAGPLPDEIKVTTTFGGAVSANSNSADAARALLQFLRTEEVVKIIRKQGMVPIS
jgi:molybdate transport system substrate-binding protein